MEMGNPKKIEPQGDPTLNELAEMNENLSAEVRATGRGANGATPAKCWCLSGLYLP